MYCAICKNKLGKYFHNVCGKNGHTVHAECLNEFRLNKKQKTTNTNKKNPGAPINRMIEGACPVCTGDYEVFKPQKKRISRRKGRRSRSRSRSGSRSRRGSSSS